MMNVCVSQSVSLKENVIFSQHIQVQLYGCCVEEQRGPSVVDWLHWADVFIEGISCGLLEVWL